ncbi:hypothetical protein GCM10009564_40300 [Streptomyces thermogriseus]|uniref:Uncharacterized protein n=1 Tax=Streptomyces thermogriseus TaxID=75292 RepID=A0ABP4DM88_9ACTN
MPARTCAVALGNQRERGRGVPDGDVRPGPAGGELRQQTAGTRSVPYGIADRLAHDEPGVLSGACGDMDVGGLGRAEEEGVHGAPGVGRRGGPGAPGGAVAQRGGRPVPLPLVRRPLPQRNDHGSAPGGVLPVSAPPGTVTVARRSPAEAGKTRKIPGVEGMSCGSGRLRRGGAR